MLESELFDQNCEKLHEINQKVIIESETHEDFNVINLLQVGDVPEEEYHKYCQTFHGHLILDIKSLYENQQVFFYAKIIIDNGRYCGQSSVERRFDLTIKMRFHQQENWYLFYCFLLLLINLILTMMIIFIKKRKEKGFNLQQYKEKKEFLFK